MTEKYRKKITKLLALAQSDNEFEAERARVQAEKLMAKHNISEGETRISTVSATVAIPRKKWKESEDYLLSAIISISGTRCFSTITKTRAMSKNTYRNVPKFMGPSHFAEMAAYTWDVLYRQLLQAKNKKKNKYGLNAAEIEQYALSYVYAASRKLTNVFGARGTDRTTLKVANSITENMAEGKSMMTKQLPLDDHTRALMDLGYAEGENANLQNATTGSAEQLKLT
jgi:predicted ribonuclease YlaK